jgi:ELWxxDGT repeat protein
VINGNIGNGQMVEIFVSGVNYGSSPTNMVNVNGTLFCMAQDNTSTGGGTGTTANLWKISGTTPTRVSSTVTSMAYQTALGNNLYFQFSDANGAELWKSDGTSGGTVLLKDIQSGSNSGNPSNLIATASSILFAANDGSTGTELWKSDGTTGGTALLKDINNATNSASATNFCTVGSTIFFSANDGVNGQELWKTDGTSAGTSLVADIQTGSTSGTPNSSNPSNLVSFGGNLYFAANNGSTNNGTELWKSDGTTTTMVKDIQSGTGSSSPTGMTVFGSYFYFAANDGTNGTELWRSDGTAGGTSLFANINAGSASGSPSQFCISNGKLFFRANNGTGSELFSTDGTTVTQVKDINTTTGTASSTPANLTDVNGVVYFAANDGSNGSELWKSDGTSAGTVMVKDINTTAGTGSNPTGLVNLGGTLYFGANDGVNGVELWKSDGTSAGTTLLKDINPGAASAAIANNTVLVGSKFYFSANDGTNGQELWQSDGTAAGTTIVADVNGGSANFSPTKPAIVGTTALYMGGTRYDVGQEVWKLNLSSCTAPAVTTNPSVQSGCSGFTASFTAAASGNPTPTVQWQVSTDGGATFNNISGATSTTLSFTTSGSQNGNKYRAVFTNSCGSATTTAATLTINVASAITTNPSVQSGCAGFTASFSAAASGTPTPTVQWQQSTDGGATFNNISGATSSTLSFTTSGSQNGNQYRAVFTNSCGSATTNAAILTVNVAAAITTNPSNQSGCAGFTASFSAAANGTPSPTVQWQVSTDGGATFNNYPGATSTTLSFTASSFLSGTLYRAVFTNSCGSAITTSASLNVNTAPAITTNPANAGVTAGNTATFTAAASGTPSPTVQWQVSTDGGATFSNISGATSTTLTFTAANPDNGNQYRAVFTNSCGSATTNAATLTVSAALTINNNPTNQSACDGLTATFTASASGTPTPTVQWQISTDNGSTFTNISGATSTTLSFTVDPSQNGYQYRAVFTNTSGSVTTTVATLTVNPNPTISLGSIPNVCFSTSPQIAVLTYTAATGSPNQFSITGWSNSSIASLSNIPLISSPINIPIPASQATGTYTANFSVANTVTGCVSQAYIISATIDTPPVVTTHPSPQTICSGSTAAFSAAAYASPTATVQWQVSTDGGATFGNISSATSSTLSFTTSSAQNGNQYRAVFTNHCGTATTTAASLTLNVAPVVGTNPTVQSGCAGFTASFNTAASGTPTPTVQWQVSTDGGATFSNISGATSSTLSFTTSGAQNGNQYRAVFTNSCSSATTTAATLTVYSATSSSTNLTICSNALPYVWNALTFTGGGTQTAHLNNSNGCDSAATLVLTVNNCANTWTGAVSTAWALAGNWTIAVPTSTTDGLIPTGLTRYPIISTTASVNNLTINSGASVTVNAGQTLQLYGNLSNTGTASLGAGTVALKGTSTFTGTTTFGNLTVSGSGTVGSAAGDKISVTGILTKSSGTLNTNNKLTLISTNLQTALIADSGGALSGNVIIQRFIPGNTGYHEITSPLSGGTVASIGGFGITGTNGVAGYLVGQAGSLAEYREPTNTYNTLDSGYYNYTTPSNPLNSGQGFTAKIGGGVTITFTGTPSNGNLSYNITNLGSNIKTAGWNLLGNPYPSPVRWSSIKAANPGVMNATCYIWKPTTASTGTWQTYNGTYGTNGVGDLLGLGQGFFVLKTATGTSTLSFDNTMRTLNLTAVSYKNDVAPDEIRLTLTSGDMTAEALSYTEAGRTAGFDEDADGVLPAIDGMDATSLAFVTKDDKYLINVIDNINETLEMPLAIHTTTPGTYTISAASLNVNAYPVYLLDKSTNTYHEIATKDVTFNSAGNEDKTNYSVVFSKKATATAPGEMKVNIWGTTGSIMIEQSATLTPSTIRVTNLLGQEVALVTTTDSRVEIPVQNTTNAIYLVSVRQNGMETVKKVMVK